MNLFSLRNDRAEKRPILCQYMNIGVAWKQNIDGNQNDAQFSHVLCFKRFFLHKFYRCVWYVYTLRVFSVRCSISTTANKREYIKKWMRHSLLYENAIETLVLSTLPMHCHRVFVCVIRRIYTAHARNKHHHKIDTQSQPLACLFTHIHSEALRYDCI